MLCLVFHRYLLLLLWVLSLKSSSCRISPFHLINHIHDHINLLFVLLQLFQDHAYCLVLLRLRWLMIWRTFRNRRSFISLMILTKMASRVFFDSVAWVGFLLFLVLKTNDAIRLVFTVSGRWLLETQVVNLSLSRLCTEEILFQVIVVAVSIVWAQSVNREITISSIIGA